MLRSMTGFGAAATDTNDYKINIELKAVNNRYCDISIRMPALLRPLEPTVLSTVNGYNFRGKIDIYINFQDNSEATKQLAVDKQLALAYYHSLQEVNSTLLEEDSNFKLSLPSLSEFANYNGIITPEDRTVDLATVEPLLIATLKEAITGFIQMKTTEGANLSQDLLARLQQIEATTKQIEQIAPERLIAYRQHLIEMLDNLLHDNDIDDSRIIQECALMADRLDITEELVRMSSHLQQFRDILNLDGNIGRKLDFIVQEMNRETNTIASKANNSAIAHLVVDIKSELEKIREQIQNIE